jgi:hypothetical protein
MTLNMNDAKQGFAKLHEDLAELETAARKLTNQNFADIVAGAKGRIHQLANHPDLELVQREMSGERNPPGTVRANEQNDGRQRQPGTDVSATRPSGQNQPGATAGGPGGVQANENPENPFKTGGPDAGKSDTFRPGDARFDQDNRNQNFRQPGAVDLNPDGTARQAPNSIGTQQDDRR